MDAFGSTGLIIGNRSYFGSRSSDSHAVAVFPTAREGQHLTTLAIVANGQMGWPVRLVKKVAAEMVVSSFVEVFSQSIPTQPRQLFVDAIETASKRLFRYCEAHTTIESLFATCAAVVVMNDRLYTVSLGDCRIYLLREKQLRQISTDHTFSVSIEAGTDNARITPSSLRRRYASLSRFMNGTKISVI
jgi:serine/threonine protein phosphatase PrpC